MKIIITSGGFDPLHSGHINYLNAAKKLGDKLFVIINTDEWLKRKKGKVFLPYGERKTIIKNLQCVDKIYLAKDNDDSVIESIQQIKKEYPTDEIIVANGGDKTVDNVPEQQVSDIKCIFNVGGNYKKNSSSWILKKWNSKYFEKRIWGDFYELFIDKQVKVKELIIYPFKHTSYQRHFKRNEIWLVSKGSCEVRLNEIKTVLNTHDYFIVKVGNWHQIINNASIPCHIIEIQYGEQTIEEDIERE
jgi:cytidyltransferase-like protein